jgi:hypothetical protein
MGESFEDEYGEYDEDAGLKEPEEGRCNALLKNWQARYGEKRYCGHSPRGCPPPGAPNFDMEKAKEAGTCRRHKYKERYRMQAKEVYQHGGYTKNRELLYDKVDPWDQIVMHALHQSLMEDSVHEYAPDHKERTFDFSDSKYEIPEEAPTDDDGNAVIEVAYPTENIDRGKVLWAAAVDAVKAENINAEITEDMMETETYADSEYDYESGEWNTLTEKQEHHLNLAYSRLITDREKLLSYGGVVTGTKADVEDNSQIIEDFTLVEPDPETIDGDGSGMADL